MMVVLVHVGVLLVEMVMMMLLLLLLLLLSTGVLAAAAQKGEVRPSHLGGDEVKKMGMFCVSGCTMDKAVVCLDHQPRATNLNDASMNEERRGWRGGQRACIRPSF